MRVHIGGYRDWIGPYQIADLLQYVGVSEERCHSIGERLAATPLNTLCEWIHKHKKQKVKVHIDRYDTWSMDSTLALIVLPMLKQLRDTKHGAPFVDDEDVPAGVNLRASEAPAKEHEWDTDANHFKRWDWVLDEMIWAFEQLHPDSDWEAQYHSGEHDIQFEPIANSDLMRMVTGPKDTHKFDSEGYTAHSKRIDAGLRLFGAYYRNLWD
ncbi:hypothetical protein UFOVP116_195 [uncultured Caudovirales phage]|uniref:Uncharacterized protein n=1 Tax=uncultured Caudovirales phage TaxID=2100421 RepID=A0A6J5L6D8_9CAUD|nr:hypothetical protein UFOVP116_195 [uncultured Caudovirales phage]